MSIALIIYAYIFTGLIVVSSIAKVWLKLTGKYDETPNSVQIEEVITIPFILLGCVAIFGALYRVPVFSALFWQTYVVLCLAHMVFSFQLPKMTWLRKELSSKAFLILNVVGVVTGLPFFFLLIDYSFISFPLQ